ncbi:MAG: DUF2383 domain-containing protein [Sphingobacteriia bacterium]|nr:DUF2383 domain-containing protein [Sphingobacteriia bacterium]
MKSIFKRSFYVALTLITLNGLASDSIAQPANNEDVAKHLQTLTQYEIDGSFILSQAIDNVKNKALKEKLTKMKVECERNIKDLAALTHEYGREAPIHSRDFKGFFMQGYAAMRGLVSDKGVMSALHTNSKLILNAFEEALNSDLPDHVKTRLQRIYNTKKSHLDYFASQM